MRQRGFTLVELLVAISVLAIVAVLGWRGLDSIVRAREGITSELEQSRGMQLAFAQMQRDASEIAVTSDIGGRPVLQADDTRVTLVRHVYADDQPSRVQVIAYRLRDGNLTRQESVPTRDLKELDVAWLAALNDTSITPLVTLQSGVERMEVQTWFQGLAGWRNAQSQPQPGAGGVAPVAIGLEIALQLRGSENNIVKVFLLGTA